MNSVPSARLRFLNDAPLRGERQFVLYWMVAARRAHWNFALQRALEWGAELGRPVVVLEALRADYPFASPRLHAFVLAGMRDNAAAFAPTPIRYLPHVEPRPHASAGLLQALAAEACVVVSDDWPHFFLPQMQKQAASRLDVRLELVDGNGITRLADSPQEFKTAHSFRRWFQQRGDDLLAETPQPDPLAHCALPRAAQTRAEASGRWDFTLPGPDLDARIAAIPLAETTPRVLGVEGGAGAALQRLHTFVHEQLGDYDLRRNTPHVPATSGLSPYLHFGHISSHQIVSAVRDGQSRIERPAGPNNGSRSGWWGLGSAREAFLDQLIIWRELGFHFCRHRSDAARFDSLPKWAIATLERHWDDARPWVYSLQQFENAATHDPLWNAAQRQLRETGVIHNYLRMLWGKKILHWSANPHEALEILLTLNDRWALDGRDPNSLSGIFWTLGRFDRPWGPERPIFGQVRYMTSENTRRKLRLDSYLDRYGEPSLFAKEQAP